MFELRKICKSFGNLRILKSISLKIKSGIVTGLIGPNGSGKTSLLRTILYILEPSEGNIYWKSKLITKSLNDIFESIQ